MERKYKCNICGERDNEAEFACLYGAPRCPECNSMEVSEDKITSGDINQNIIKGMYTGQNGPDKFRKDCEKLFATGTNLNSDQLQTIWDKVCENPFFSDVSVGLFVRYQEFFFFAHEILAQVNVPASSPAKDTNPEIVTQCQDDVRSCLTTTEKEQNANDSHLCILPGSLHHVSGCTRKLLPRLE